MSPVIAYMICGALGLLIGVAMLEISEGREKDRRRADEFAEFEEWLRARDVTGRVK